MDRRRFLTWMMLASLAFATAVGAGGQAGAARAAGRERILAEARRILDNVRDTRYSHKTVVSEEQGSYAVDCSGLLCYVLGRVAPAALELVPVEEGRSRQRAVTFHDAFAAAPTARPERGWQRIERVIDARPGDLIAWRKQVTPKTGNTGHCGIVMEPPWIEEDGLVRVRILDSTSTGHADDRRSAKDRTGVGRGTVWFQVDAKSRPVALHWSSRDRKATAYPIAIGRLILGGDARASESRQE